MEVEIIKIDIAKKTGGGKSWHMMRITREGYTDVYMREEFKDGSLRWSIENKGMYDEQNDTNSASLERTFQKNL